MNPHPVHHSPILRPWRAPRRIFELVRNRALAAPGALAVASPDRSVSYGELDGEANRLAHELVELGVGPEVIVGLQAPRSAEMILGALAIFKAGGAYLPLDPRLPPERLRAILADARCRFLLSSPDTSGQLEGAVEHALLASFTGARAEHPPESRSTFESLAYVIYTSGPGQRPVGVEITHASLMNLIHWHHLAFKVAPADRASLLAPVGSDRAVWEVWPYLTAGASLHLPGEEVSHDPAPLRDWLLEQRITVTFMPPPLAEEMVALRWPAQTPLRAMLTGGGALLRHPPQELPFRLFNHYGPAEVTVVTTSGLVAHRPDDNTPPPIGRPILNTQVRVLDPELRELPAGTPGELHIGGAGLARGYLHHPELTAERFVKDPFSDDPEARLYRTGDKCVALPDEQLVFLGRIGE